MQKLAWLYNDEIWIKILCVISLEDLGEIKIYQTKNMWLS